MAPNFSRAETSGLFKLFEDEIMTYYELYEMILDQNPQFSFKCQCYNPVPVAMEKRIFEGEVLEVETVEIFKDIVGERAPKEEKKDAKKK